MGYNTFTPIVTNGLVLCLDAGNTKSYPGSGATWTDLSSNGNNGTLISSPAYSSSNGGVLTFNGSQYGTIPAASSLAFNDNFTISSWVKVTAFNGTGYNGIAGRFGPTTNFGGYELECNNQNGGNKFGFVVGNNGGASINNFRRINSDIIFSFNLWYHVVGTNISGLNKLYVNGQVQSTTYTFNVVTNSSQLFAIGRIYADNNQYYHIGNIANISVYNRGLTDAEVLQNYNATKGRFI